jgi:hypothetical protein
MGAMGYSYGELCEIILSRASLHVGQSRSASIGEPIHRDSGGREEVRRAAAGD